jgi:hypothetical protein
MAIERTPYMEDTAMNDADRLRREIHVLQEETRVLKAETAAIKKKGLRAIFEACPDIATLRAVLGVLQTLEKANGPTRIAPFINKVVVTLEAVQDISALPAALDEAFRE